MIVGHEVWLEVTFTKVETTFLGRDYIVTLPFQGGKTAVVYFFNGTSKTVNAESCNIFGFDIFSIDPLKLGEKRA